MAQQQFLVDQMKAIPHTDFSDEDAMRVLAIIAFYAAHQTANSEVNKPARSPEVAAAVPARQQFYVQQTATYITRFLAKEVTGGPALDNVARIRCPEQLTQKMTAILAGTVTSMAPMACHDNRRTDSIISGLLSRLA